MKLFELVEVVDYVKLDPAILICYVLKIVIFVVVCLAKIEFDLKLGCLLNHFNRKLIEEIFVKDCVLFGIRVQFLGVKKHFMQDRPLG